MSGVRIGNYVLHKTLGVGSFGKVKLAEHEKTHHKVAVKILNRQKIKSMGMDQKIRREIHILRLFVHPHVIRLYQVIETPTDIFLVMEYVDGGELFEYIVRKGRLTEHEARKFFQQIISGVEYCHAHNVVHRDLKPENLLLDSDGNVKIADFGLSNVMKDGEFLRTSCGSPNYAAPEVISGKLYAGPEVDVWSCGVILYALLCGRLPFDEDSIVNLFRRIKAADYTLPDYLPDQAKKLIQQMLVVDPVKRITIDKIRENPWFRTNLPNYIAAPALDMSVSEADPDVVSEVLEKYSEVSRDELLADLRAQKVNGVTAAYHLTLDHKRRKQIAEMQRRANSSSGGAAGSTAVPPRMAAASELVVGSFDVGFSPAVVSPLDMQNFGTNVIGTSPGVLVMMGDRGDRPAASGAATGSMLNAPLGTTPTARGGVLSMTPQGQRWYLGVHSRRSPVHIMTEVFRALKHFGFKWKVVTPYQLRCVLYKPHWAASDRSPPSSPMDERHLAASTGSAGGGGGGGGGGAAAPSSGGAPTSSSGGGGGGGGAESSAIPVPGVATTTVGASADSPSTPLSPGRSPLVGGGSPHDTVALKLGVVLYRVTDKRCLLDFYKIQGDMFLFFVYCGKLINALKHL